MIQMICIFHNPPPVYAWADRMKNTPATASNNIAMGVTGSNRLSGKGPSHSEGRLTALSFTTAYQKLD